MAEDYVRVELDPPRTLRQAAKSYFLHAKGCEELQLPCELTVVEMASTPDGDIVVAVDIPRFIAMDRGLLEAPTPVEEAPEVMTRHDWFMLGATMAFLVRGDTTPNALWEARKVALQLKELSNV